MRSDEQLLACAARGDGEAFAEFYERHVIAVTSYVRRGAGSPEAAFDLAAETFASAVTGLGGFDPQRGSARGWLFGIARNELRQAWRRGRIEDRARRVLALEPIVLDDDALRRVEQSVDPAVLEQALAALPAAERAAIEARVLDERDYEEIATALECSALVVRQRVSRGLRRMRSMMERGT